MDLRYGNSLSDIMGKYSESLPNLFRVCFLSSEAGSMLLCVWFPIIKKHIELHNAAALSTGRIDITSIQIQLLIIDVVCSIYRLLYKTAKT
jgi:hypothetical protein